MEEAFRGYQMKGTFPFTILNLRIEPELMDVNVHPAKLEIRFYDNEQIFHAVRDAVSSVLYKRENIPSFTVGPKDEADKEPVTAKQFVPEPFEENRVRQTSTFSEEPVYTVENYKVHVTVGSTEHPMTPEHHIAWMVLQTNHGIQLRNLDVEKGPTMVFTICEKDEVEAVYAYCNLHGLWKA